MPPRALENILNNSKLVSNLFAKLRMYIEACSVCQRIKPKQDRNKPYYCYIPKDYLPLEHLAVDIKYMPDGFDNFKYIVLTTCEHTNFIFCYPYKRKRCPVNIRCTDSPGVHHFRPTTIFVCRQRQSIDQTGHYHLVTVHELFNADH